jgi:hypothetical protein
MICPSCQTEWGAVNQHSKCPGCGAKIQTQSQILLEDTHAEVKRQHDAWATDMMDTQERAQTCVEYYHGRQWTRQELAELDRRNQPPIVKNRIAKKINFLLGDEVRNRTDPKALPRTPKEGQDAIAMTDALRYVADENNADQIFSRVWRDILIAGFGAAVVEDEVRGGAEQTEDGAETAEISVKIRRVSWDRLWWDVRSRDTDYSDAGLIGIDTWWHLEDARAYYATRDDAIENWEELLEQSVDQDDGLSDTLDDKPRWILGEGRGRRLLVTERYQREADPDTGQPRWTVCHAAWAGLLVAPKPTGHLDDYGNDICPVVAVSGFVDDNEGIRYGLVWNMLSPQDELNKRSSKMLHLLSVDRTVAEQNAVLDLEEARQERARPDGIVVVQRGALENKRIIFENGLAMAQGHHAMMQESKQDLDQIGPEIPQIGSVAGGASGRALQQRQMIGSLEIAPLHDQLKTFRREIYKRVWWRIRQVWPTEKWLRVRDDDEKTGYRFVGLNRPIPRGKRFAELLQQDVPPQSALEAVGENPALIEQIAGGLVQAAQQKGQQIDQQQAQNMALEAVMKLPRMAGVITANDVAQLGVDIILEETPDTSIIQHEEVEELTKVLQSVLTTGVAQQDPSLVKQILTMIVEAGELRTKKKLLQILQQPPDPQQVQMQQQQQQAQMQQIQLSLQQMQASIANIASQTQLNQAKAAGEAADAQATPAVTQADVDLKGAQAMKAAADAGDKAGQIQ